MEPNIILLVIRWSQKMVYFVSLKKQFKHTLLLLTNTMDINTAHILLLTNTMEPNAATTNAATTNAATTNASTSMQSYIRTDDNKIINEKCIRWATKMGDCLHVCIKTTGCAMIDTHKICKLNNHDGYNKLNKHFLGEPKVPL